MYVFPNHHFHDHTEVHHNGNLINYLANWLLVVFHFSVLYLIWQEMFFYKFISTFLIILNTFSLITSYYFVKVWELKKGLWSIFLNYSLRSLYYFTFPPQMYTIVIFLKTEKKMYAVLFLTLCMKTVRIIKCFSLYFPPFYYFKHYVEGMKVIVAVTNLMIF